VQIELTTITVSKRGCGRPPIADHLETIVHQLVDEAAYSRHIDDEIEVFVRSGLLAHKRVDTPPAVNPRPHARFGETVKDSQNLFSGDGA
jgi:hypothetical protein